MGIKIIYGITDKEYVYKDIREYPELYMNIKNSIKNKSTITFYTDNLDIFRWCGFFQEAYPSFVKLIKKEVKKTKETLIHKTDISEPNCKDLDEWKKWIIQEYFPYKEIKDIEKNCLDAEKIGYIQKFSDFYYSNYNQLKLSEGFISNILHDSGESIRKDEISFILIIDNFNFNLKNILKNFLFQKNIKVNSENFYFTTIPSETRFGKQALLSLSPTNFKENWNVATLSELKNKFRDKNIEYKNKISELNQLELKKDTVYVINYLEIDELLHTDNLKLAGDILEKAATELEKISLLIEETLKNKEKIGIYIVTDHGSIKTYPNSKIDNQILNNLSKKSGEVLMELSNGDIEKNRVILEKFGYIVDREKYLLDKNYYIAKQGVYFKNVTSEKYIHGGLSPDEICIPFLKLKNY